MRDGLPFPFFCLLLSSTLLFARPGAVDVTFNAQDTGFGHGSGANRPVYVVEVQHNSTGRLALEHQMNALENTPIALRLRKAGLTGGFTSSAHVRHRARPQVRYGYPNKAASGFVGQSLSKTVDTSVHGAFCQDTRNFLFF